MNTPFPRQPFPLLISQLCLGLAGPLWAQTKPTVPEPAAQETAEEARELRRVLHLHGGSTLRAVTRRAEADWEYKAGSEWRRLPAGSVARAVPEKEVLAQLRVRRAESAKADPGARTALARWMMEEGLLEEALQETEKMLAAQRELEDVRNLLRENAHRFRRPNQAQQDGELSERVVALIQEAAPATHSLREMIIVDLEALGERELLREPLRAALFDSSLRRRSFAALALRRLFPGEEAQALLQRSVLDSSEEVRREAAVGLAATEEPGLILPIVRAMENSASHNVRRNAAEALGNMGYPAAVPALINRLHSLQGGTGNSTPHSNIFVGRQIAFVQDFDVEVAQFQAVADPQINIMVVGQTTDVGVTGVQEIAFASERRVIQHSLQQITGADPGNYARDWIAWWSENRARYEVSGAGPQSSR